jgi:hypothetical protein
MHQREETALRAQVIEAREQRDAAVREASEKVEAMKKGCEGIPSSFFMSSIFKFCLQLTCFLFLGLALCVEKWKLLECVEEIKILVCNNHNRTEEVITLAEEELALAKLIRHRADRDLVHV